jgi:hypothetical protein
LSLPSSIDYVPEVDWSYIEEERARKQRYQEAVIALASSASNQAKLDTVGVSNFWPASMGWKKDGRTFQVTEGIVIGFSSAENKRCVIFKKLTQFRGAWAEVRKLASMTNFSPDEVRQALSQIRDEKIKGRPAEDHITLESRDAHPGAYRILVTPIIEEN